MEAMSETTVKEQFFTKNWDWALVFACSSASQAKVRYENIIGTKEKEKEKLWTLVQFG